MYDSDSKEELQLADLSSKVKDVVFSHNGSKFVIIAGPNLLRIFTSKIGDLIATNKREKRVISIKFSEDDTKLICCGEEERMIIVYDVSDIENSGFVELSPIDSMTRE